MPSVEEFKKRNFYQRLGVSPEATLDEIKEAYRDIARVYHPDSTFYGELVTIELTPDDEAIFQMVTAAYNTLVREDARTSYDSTLRTSSATASEGSGTEPGVKGTREWNAKQQKKQPTMTSTKIRIRRTEQDDSPTSGPQVTRVAEQSMDQLRALREPPAEPSRGPSVMMLVVGGALIGVCISIGTLLLMHH